MTRKRIRVGIMMGDVSGTFFQPAFRGIREACHKYQCDLIVFEGREVKSKISISDQQHNAVYQLISEKNIDGLICCGDIFNSIEEDQRLDFINTLPPLPIVGLNTTLPQITSIMLEDSMGIKSLMQHLVLDHCYSQFAFVTGPDGNEEAMSRLNAFKECIQYYKIELDDQYIIPGNFRPSSGIEAAKKILTLKPLPDVIVCANDDMALTCGLELQRLEGPQILKKIAITGFDDISSAQYMSPPLTTIRQPIKELMEACVKNLIHKISGKVLPKKIKIGTELVLRQSCGCQQIKPIQEDSESILQLNNFRVHDNMQAANQTELLNLLTQALPFFDIKCCYIALYETRFFNDKPPPSSARLIYAFRDGSRFSVDSHELFDTKQLLPNDIEIPETAILREIFFKNEHFGYMIFDGFSRSESDYEQIRGQFCNMFKSVTLIEELQSAYNRLENQSLTDDLTGLLNRRGLYKHLNEVIGNPLTQSNILVCFADMDDLKGINDTFGHETGDIAISKVAICLQDHFPDAAIGRLGGDEFLLIFITDKTFCLWKKMKHFKKSLFEKSSFEKDGFRLGISLGAAYSTEVSHCTIKNILKLADQRLYKRKILKKRLQIKNAKNYHPDIAKYSKCYANSKWM